MKRQRLCQGAKKEINFCGLNAITKGLKVLGLLFLLLNNTSNAQNTVPSYYWTFDGTVPLKDSVANATLNTTSYNCIYTIDNPVSGSVGKSLKLNDQGRMILAAQNFVLDTALTIEFLFKPALYFNTTQFMNRKDNAFMIKMGYPYLQFSTNILNASGATVSDVMKIDLEGINRATYGYYTDGNWHHLVFKYNTLTGQKEIWVDGQLPAGFSKTTATGTFNKNAGTPNNNDVCFNSNTSYYKFFGNIDEIALYNKSLPANNIYKHCLDAQQQRHYTYANSALAVPAPTAVSAAVDINDYAPGHPSYSVNAVDQLKNFPLPRYKSNHTLTPNFNWLGLRYLSGEFQPGTSYSSAVTNSIAIQRELAKNFNYSILVSSNTSNASQYNDVTKYHGAWVNLANQNPQWKTAAISFWAQLNPSSYGFTSNTGYIENKNLTPQHYIRNASGQFLNLSGQTSTIKYWSPAAPADSFIQDGTTQFFQIRNLMQALTRPLDMICENAEVIPKPSANAMQADPDIVVDKVASGIADWDLYLGSKKKILSSVYRDQFMFQPGLANTIYCEYQISGHPTTRHKYAETRFINRTPSGQHLATPDFYPRWPSNWLTGVSAWNGWQHIIDGRYYEITAGDKLFSPFVAAGWNEDEERNIRPGQWLGLLKCLGMLGAEYYYAGFFNEASSYTPPNPPPANPAGYVWQAVVPSYAQAVTSHYEDILRNGTLLNGDKPNSYSNPTAPGYSFEAGDARKMVVIRKHNTDNIYAITGTIQPNSNMAGNTEIESEANITLNGQSLKFRIRRQGSTYIYDNRITSAPVFYQLDEWHESSHPYRWSNDFNLEAELAENATGVSTTIKTDKPAGSAAGDYRTFTSYVSFTNTSTPLNFKFEPRSTTNLYVWVRARSVNGSATGFNINLDNGTQKSIGCITDTNWNWYSLDACSQQAIAFLNTSAAAHSLVLTASNTNLLVDKVMLTVNSSLQLNSNQAACNASVATVTATGSTSFCQGKNVTLKASQGTSYLWSSGQTTQSIVVSSAGNYLVTVSNGSGCAAVSSPLTVTVFSNPTATITASGNTSFCEGDSVSLAASNASGYLWSNGLTTSKITVKASGSYLVTVTNANGCTAVSASVNVVSNSLPNATISASGTTQLMAGQNVTFTASGGSNYVWNPGGQTDPSITVSTAGTYSVTAFNSAGCSSTSSQVNVTVTASLNPVINSGGTTYLCPGSTLTLTSDPAFAYNWMPGGETSQSITINTAGIYTLKISDAYGNNAQKSITIEDGLKPDAPSISINYIPNTAYQLTASEPSATNYLWSTAETTSTINVTVPNIYTVTAINAYGCQSESSSIDVNSISGQACGKADMLTAYAITDSAATIGWNPAVTGDSFVLKVWKENTNVVTTINLNGTVSNYRIGNLVAGTNYVWQVQTKCVGMTQTSDEGRFSTLSSSLPCGSIPIDLSASNINTITAYLNWYPTIATSFKVRYKVVGAAGYHTRIYNGTTNIDGGLLTNLAPSTMYEWSIQSICNGITTNYSQPSYFTTINPCGYMGNVTILNVTPTTALIQWDNLTSMDTIRIRVKNTVNGRDRNIYINGTNNTGQYLITQLNTNTTYLVDVRGKCYTGALGAWTTKVPFTTGSISGRLIDNNPLELNGYPNPTSINLHYVFTSDEESDYTLKLCDMSGRELLQTIRYADSGENVGTIDVENYPTGMYLMIVQKGSQTSRFRFTVE